MIPQRTYQRTYQRLSASITFSPLTKTLKAVAHLLLVRMKNMMINNIPIPTFQGKAQKVITTELTELRDIP